MNRFRISLLRLSAFVAISFSALAQEPLSTKSKKAIEYYLSSDNYRVRGQLDQAIGLLKQAIAKDPKFEEAYYRLGLTLRSSGDISAAIKNFETGLALAKDQRKVKNYSYILGETYLRLGKYEQASSQLDKFLVLEKLDKVRLDQAKVWKSQSEYGVEHRTESFGYKIQPLSDTVNAYPLQYFPTITADETELIFTIRFGNAHNDNEDIMVSRKASNGRWGMPTSLSDQVNSNFREGASTISADGRKLIFTICGPRGCDLYESNKTGNVWGKPISLGLGVNTSGWEAQPTLSADGNELYFVSDRKGGIGGYDIWYSRKGDDGAWGKAVNLGKQINTPFDEIAPFIHVNNQNLYFASNGLPGFGSYDIYQSEKTLDHFPSPLEKVSAIGRTDEVWSWSQPTNLGAPLNDFEDQYSFAVTSNGKSAYYSKEEGRNKSKIYTTIIPKEFQVVKKGNLVSGVVTDAEAKIPLIATIELRELLTNQVISRVKTDSVSGNYLIVIPGRAEYALFVSSKGYLFSSQHFDYKEMDTNTPLQLDFQLQLLKKDASVILNNIFFDLDKYELGKKSKTELIEVLLLLKNNPSLTIEISGHTDNAGSELYNKELSLRRANSVADYLINSGIAKNRVSKKGYGSQKPIRPNNSEENRQFNRRIEFKVL